MAAEQVLLNRDHSCPKCGDVKAKIIGPAGRVVFNGQEMVAPVKYRIVIECANCRSIRGR